VLNTKVSTATANVEADAVGALCNDGYLRIYGGVQPDDGDAGAPDTALATLRFASEAFRPAAGGVIASNPLLPDMATAGSGEPTWFRAFQSDGITPVFDGSVGTADCNINVQVNPGVPLIVYPGGEFHLSAISFSVRRA